MKAKHKNQVLDTAWLEQEFFDDVHLTGIVSASEYYRLVSFINQRLGLNFVKNHELDILMNGVIYPVFAYKDNEKLIEHYIFCNRRKTNYMMTDARNIDFIWMMKGNLQYQPEITRLRELLKKVEGVDFSFNFQPSALKMKQLLII